LPKGLGLHVSFDVFIIVRTTDGQTLAFFPARQGSPFSDQARFPKQHLVYQAYAMPIGNRTDTSISNPVEIVRTSDIILPQAFSPNNDGKNDTLVAITRFIQEATITIYDSWGTAVYKSNLPFAWPGTTPAGQAPPGSYVALVQAKTQEGKSIVQRKWVTIAP
jgi:gliding motility-associated-like protein